MPQMFCEGYWVKIYDFENIKIIAKISALMTHYHRLLKINRWESSLNLRQALDRPKEQLLPKEF